MKNFAVAIFGPTGIGKSSIALKLAKENGEIISVDSMQVYKYMNVGTAKPGKNELKLVKHHLIDFVTPDIQFTAGDFKRQAQLIIEQILNRKKVPYLVGGTGLYFTALMRGMIDIPKIKNDIKDFIILKWNKIGQERMYKILSKLDCDYSKIIHPNDKQRTLRALEVILGTGKKFSEYISKKNQKIDINFISVGINIEREILYRIINNRVDKMIKDGFIEEVKDLLNKGYNKNDPGMKAIGYKELVEYIEGRKNLEETIQDIKRNSRRYAKRQLTWFKKIDNVYWFKNDEINEIKNYVENQIDNL